MKGRIHPEITQLNQIYFDSADPASDPDLYLRSITNLAAQVPKKSLKLVVNTCGWVEGLGAFLLGQFLRILPANTQVIELTSSKPCEIDFKDFKHLKIKGDLCKSQSF